MSEGNVEFYNLKNLPSLLLITQKCKTLPVNRFQTGSLLDLFRSLVDQGDGGESDSSFTSSICLTEASFDAGQEQA